MCLFHSRKFEGPIFDSHDTSGCVITSEIPFSHLKPMLLLLRVVLDDLKAQAAQFVQQVLKVP